MFVLGEIEFINILLFKARESKACLEGVRLGNFLDRFEKCAAIREVEVCRTPPGRSVSIVAALSPSIEAISG